VSDARVGAGQIVLGSFAVLVMLLTAYFFLDMKWIAQPLYLMASVIASAFGDGV